MLCKYGSTCHHPDNPVVCRCSTLTVCLSATSICAASASVPIPDFAAPVIIVLLDSLSVNATTPSGRLLVVTTVYVGRLMLHSHWLQSASWHHQHGLRIPVNIAPSAHWCLQMLALPSVAVCMLGSCRFCADVTYLAYAACRPQIAGIMSDVQFAVCNSCCTASQQFCL